ncbi:Intersectin-2 [Dimargaris xerosporica]|nr:Intersectin-2 [Dimargaris xerosporica]
MSHFKGRALYDCAGEDDGEISFHKGDLILQLYTTDQPGWLYGTVKRTNQGGLVPANYVELFGGTVAELPSKPGGKACASPTISSPANASAPTASSPILAAKSGDKLSKPALPIKPAMLTQPSALSGATSSSGQAPDARPRHASLQPVPPPREAKPTAHSSKPLPITKSGAPPLPAKSTKPNSSVLETSKPRPEPTATPLDLALPGKSLSSPHLPSQSQVLSEDTLSPVFRAREHIYPRFKEIGPHDISPPVPGRDSGDGIVPFENVPLVPNSPKSASTCPPRLPPKPSPQLGQNAPHLPPNRAPPPPLPTRNTGSLHRSATTIPAAPNARGLQRSTTTSVRDSGLGIADFAGKAQKGPHPDKAPKYRPGQPGIPRANRRRYDMLFKSLDDDRDGFITKAQGRQTFIKSQLDEEILGDVWALSDRDRRGKLSQHEFAIAMYLIDEALAGQPVPLTLPLELLLQ